MLGRHGERPGGLSSRLLVDGPSGPVLRTGLETAVPHWDGAAGTDGARAVGHVVLAGEPARQWSAAERSVTSRDPEVRWAASSLAGDAVLVTAVSASASGLTALLDIVLRAVLTAQPPGGRSPAPTSASGTDASASA